MPIRVQDELPAVNFLRSENVFVMTTTRATTQEIRPLKVLILNLMPKKSRRRISPFELSAAA
jgi:homoserine O-succinyltransferase